MLTPLGKALRMFRLEKGELLKDMSSKLGVTPAYLSAIENGKKEPTQEFMARLYRAYHFDTKQREKIEEARARTVRQISISFDSEEDEELGLLFARRMKGLSHDERSQIMKLLKDE